mgnify:CR=1 FL=1
MNYKLKNISNLITNMHYLEVIDWLKDKSEDYEYEISCSIDFFENECEDNEDLQAKVKKKIEGVIKYNKK